jgi:hypothetical protein
MPPLERLFALEVEFHRRLGCEAPGTPDATPLHTSFALQTGYEWLMQRVGHVTAQDIERLIQHLAVARDTRDVLAARDSLTRLLGLWTYPK